jgi:hypothetical protein
VLFVDLGRIHGERRLAEAWEKVRSTPARFICLNNIPPAQATAFARTMAQRGLAPPGAEDASTDQS